MIIEFFPSSFRLHYRDFITTIHSTNLSRFVVTTTNVTAHETSRNKSSVFPRIPARSTLMYLYTYNALPLQVSPIHTLRHRLHFGLRDSWLAYPPIIRSLLLTKSNLGSRYEILRLLRSLGTFTLDMGHARHTKKTVNQLDLLFTCSFLVNFYHYIYIFL